MQQDRRNKPEAPLHVALIMDGNGRWARERSLPRVEGHRVGVSRIRSVLELMDAHNVKHVTIYAFSTENWNRPQHEVSGIMAVLREVIDDETRALHKIGVRILHLGSTHRLDPDLKEAINHAQDLTRDNTRMTLSVAFDYGGRSEIVQAVRGLIRDNVPAEAVDEDLLARYLYTPGIPDPDLIIRTGGELRLSNFLLWQSAYSEFYTTPVPWPEFGPQEIEEALRSYHKRKRRFGAVDPGD